MREACRELAREAKMETKRRYAKAKYDVDPAAGKARMAAIRASWAPDRHEAAKAYARARRVLITCEACGSEWEAHDKGRGYQGRRACSLMCRAYLTHGKWSTCELPTRRDPRTCDRCERAFTPRSQAQRHCGTEDCRPRRLFATGPCAWCHAHFTAIIWMRSPDVHRWCSKDCKRRHKQYLWNVRNETGRGFTADERLAVYQRDNWCCHICGDPVNRLASVPELDAPTIDHVIALARGGKHAMDNWRTAHFYCNSYKRDLDMDQIA
jgi:5-methylcytosine-specific restriction endonuclease McrA